MSASRPPQRSRTTQERILCLAMKNYVQFLAQSQYTAYACCKNSSELSDNSSSVQLSDYVGIGEGVGPQSLPQDSCLLLPLVPPPRADYPYVDYFCGEQPPSISVSRYCDRISTYFCCSPEVHIFALAYLRRLVSRGFPFHNRTIHRLLLSAHLLATKARDDCYYHMKYYAEVCGVTLRDLLTMEFNFLVHLTGYNVEVSPGEYRTVCDELAVILHNCEDIAALLPPGESDTAALSLHPPVPMPHVENVKQVGSYASELCGVSGTDTPRDDQLREANPPAWVTACKLHW